MLSLSMESGGPAVFPSPPQRLPKPGPSLTPRAHLDSCPGCPRLRPAVHPKPQAQERGAAPPCQKATIPWRGDLAARHHLAPATRSPARASTQPTMASARKTRKEKAWPCQAGAGKRVKCQVSEEEASPSLQAPPTVRPQQLLLFKNCILEEPPASSRPK